MTRLLDGRVGGQAADHQQNLLMEGVSTSATDKQIIYGVDFDEGQATWGDVKIYRSNLKQFAKRHINDLPLIIKLLEANQIDEAAKVLHALKGTSGNLAMRPIYEGIVVISNALKQGDKQSALQQLQQLTPTYLKTLETIAAIPVEVDDEEESIDLLSVQALSEQLGALTQGLQQGRVEDESYRSVIGQLQLQGTPKGMLSSLIESIDTFEFEQAVQSLHEIQAWLTQEIRGCDGE